MMSRTKIYFANAADTSIAAENSEFINALGASADKISEAKVISRPQDADIVVIDERYEYRTWHYGGELASCSFVRRFAERICVINHDSYARVFLPGLYVSLEHSRPPLVSAATIPYKRDLWKVRLPGTFSFTPKKLYAFRGTFHTYPVRKKMCRALAKLDDGPCEELRKRFHSHNESDQKRYISEIQDARFSLCPRGLSPSSYRLFESMQIGRCPVVISDDWIPPEGPDWEQFCILVPEHHVKHLPALLLENTHRAEPMGRKAYEAWQNYFSWPTRWKYFVEQVLAFRKSQNDSLGFIDLQQIWNSDRFRRLYQWTLMDRIKQRVRKEIHSIIERPPES